MCNVCKNKAVACLVVMTWQGDLSQDLVRNSDVRHIAHISLALVKRHPKEDAVAAMEEKDVPHTQAALQGHCKGPKAHDA